MTTFFPDNYLDTVLLGILSIRFWHVSGVVPSRSSATLSHGSCTPLSLAGFRYLLRAFFKSIQRCSMGLMSGNCIGQAMTSMLLSSNHFFAFLEVCFGTLSC